MKQRTFLLMTTALMSQGLLWISGIGHKPIIVTVHQSGLAGRSPAANPLNTSAAEHLSVSLEDPSSAPR